MRDLNNSLFISGFTLVFFIIYSISSSSALVRRFNYDAILYEEFSVDSKYVQFSRTNKDLWKDLPKLAKKEKFHYYAMICTRGGGSWIAYPKQNYLLGNGAYYTLITGESCFEADDIKSIQPLGDIQLPLEDGVIVFPKEHFQSDAKVVPSGSYTGDIGSILYSGGYPWTLTSGSDNVCIMSTYHDHGDSNILCLIPTLDSSLKMKAGKKTIKQKCEGAKARLIPAQMCYSAGVHRIYPTADFSYANMRSICSGAGKELNGTVNKFNLIMEIWKGRISHGIEEMENIKIPFEATYKQRVLWQFINVFQVACPIVSPHYISLLRNVFLMHLRNAWTKQPDLIGVEDEYWRHAYMFLTSCGDNIAHTPVLHDQGGHCSPSSDSGMGHFHPDDGAYQEMFDGADYDIVIEQVWLMLNLVTPYCNWINDYKTNDWAEIVILFRRHFLEPLGKQWMFPGQWQRLYPAMFHGYDIGMERMKMLTCIENALLKTPHFDPIGRTGFFLRKEKSLIEKQYLIDHPNELKEDKGSGGGDEKPEKPEVVVDDVDKKEETVDDGAEVPAVEEAKEEGDSEVKEEGGEDAEKGRSVKKGKSFKLPIVSKRQR